MPIETKGIFCQNKFLLQFSTKQGFPLQLETDIVMNKLVQVVQPQNEEFPKFTSLVMISKMFVSKKTSAHYSLLTGADLFTKSF